MDLIFYDKKVKSDSPVHRRYIHLSFNLSSSAFSIQFLAQMILVVIFALLFLSTIFFSGYSTQKFFEGADLTQGHLVEHHRHQKRVLHEFLKSGRCHHLYVDMGTNVGVQIRKLYEPMHYPGAKILPVFEDYFGNNTRKSVCAIGFEANDVHNSRLIELQTSYQNAGYPCVIFTETAVSVRHGNLTFFHDNGATPAQHEWGASALAWHPNHPMNQTVLGIDIDAFFHEVHHAWSHSTSYSSEHSRVVAKLDIEGSEYEVVPHMLSHGSLCFIDAITIEWHDHMWPASFEYRKPQDLIAMLKWATGTSKTCKFTPLNMDDETYGTGSDEVPLPSQQTNSTTLVRKRSM